MRLTVGSQAAHDVISLQYNDVAHTQDLFRVGSGDLAICEFSVASPECMLTTFTGHVRCMQHVAIEHVH